MTIRLFCENSRSRSDNVGAVARILLKDKKFNWKTSTYSQMLQISALGKAGVLRQGKLDAFFAEFKEAQKR